MVHIAVVGLDLEGEVADVHAVAVGVLEDEAQLVGVFGQRDLLVFMLAARDDEGVEAVPEGREFARLCRVGLAQGAEAEFLEGGRSGYGCGPVIGLFVEAGPGDGVVGTRLEVQLYVVGFQLCAFDITPHDVITLVVADKQCGLIDLTLESIGKFHIIIVDEMHAVFARLKRIVGEVVARGHTGQHHRTDCFCQYCRYISHIQLYYILFSAKDNLVKKSEQPLHAPSQRTGTLGAVLLKKESVIRG